MAMEMKAMIDQRLAPILAQILTPKMLAMLRVLHLPYQQLVEEMQTQAEENVFLELERRDDLLRYARYLAKSAGERFSSVGSGDETPKFEEISEGSESLTDHLLKQLDLEDLPPYKVEIARELIAHIDEAGYIHDYAQIRDKLAQGMNIDPRVVNQVLKVIQTFEPEGVGARSVKECLLIQVWEHNFDHVELRDILEKAIRYHLDDLAKRNDERIAEALGITEEGVRNIEHFIRNNLNPKPGLIFGEKKESRHIVPSFQVELKGEEADPVITNLEATHGPVLRISKEYLQLLEDPKTDQKTLVFLRQKFEAAQNLLENIMRRQQTVQRIVEQIVGTQKLFLEKGPHWIRPLMQKEIAEKLSLHPSTVSRAISQKYLQTFRGIYSLKFLCPRAYKGYTVPQIKAMIADIIAQENGQNGKPLSDIRIKNRLFEMGIQIERRTIAKYRKELKIPPSFLRRKRDFSQERVGAGMGSSSG